MVRQVKLAILLAYLTAVLVKQACAHSSCLFSDIGVNCFHSGLHQYGFYPD